MAYLIIYTPNAPAQKLKLEGAVTVGRAIGCGLWIDDKKLSREHCRIEPRGDQWMIIDLDSTNGTRLHGRRVRRFPLVDGDTIEVGKASIVFKEGRYIERRPLDPIEAASMGMGKLTRESDPADSTVIDQRLTARRPLPTPRIQSEIEQREKVRGEVPLAFTRPPARPMVKSDSPDDSGSGSGWMQAVVSRLRGD